MEKVMHGKALAQKLRQRNHVKIGRRINPTDNRLDLVAGTDRNRRLGCHNRITVQTTGQFLGRGINILQIGFFGNRMRRRADRKHNHVRTADRLRHIQRKRQCAAFQMLLKQLLHSVFINRGFSGRQSFHFFGNLVNADNRISQLGKPYARRQAHITGSNNRNFHFQSLVQSKDSDILTTTVRKATELSRLSTTENYFIRKICIR